MVCHQHYRGELQYARRDMGCTVYPDVLKDCDQILDTFGTNGYFVV